MHQSCRSKLPQSQGLHSTSPYRDLNTETQEQLRHIAPAAVKFQLDTSFATVRIQLTCAMSFLSEWHVAPTYSSRAPDLAWKHHDIVRP